MPQPWTLRTPRIVNGYICLAVIWRIFITAWRYLSNLVFKKVIFNSKFLLLISHKGQTSFINSVACTDEDDAVWHWGRLKKNWRHYFGKLKEEIRKWRKESWEVRKENLIKLFEGEENLREGHKQLALRKRKN